MTSYRYIGKGKTDSNGIAHITTDANGNNISSNPGYTGVGAGVINVVASLDNPIDDSSVVSQPTTVLDCISYDNCTLNDHNDNAWLSTTFSNLHRDEEYSYVTEYDVTNYSVYLNEATVGRTIEFEIKMAGTSGNAICNVFSIINGSYKSLNWVAPSHLGFVTEDIQNKWVHYKIDIGEESSTITCVSDPTKSATRSYDFELSPTHIRFTTASTNTNILLRNIRVYPSE